MKTLLDCFNFGKTPYTLYKKYTKINLKKSLNEKEMSLSKLRTNARTRNPIPNQAP